MGLAAGEATENGGGDAERGELGDARGGNGIRAAGEKPRERRWDGQARGEWGSGEIGEEALQTASAMEDARDGVVHSGADLGNDYGRHGCATWWASAR